ncbi:unnamed protein product, partial [Amoebophrya sp. A25]
ENDPSICAVCQEKLREGDAVCSLASGARFHDACFKCNVCNEPITTENFVRDRSARTITCGNCLPKCPHCGETVSVFDKSVSAPDGTQFHAECLRCDRCKASLLEGFFHHPHDA